MPLLLRGSRVSYYSKQETKVTRPPSLEKKPSAGDILAQAIRLLQLWDDGRTIQELLPAGAHPLLQNGLFTLFRHRAELDWILEQLAERPVRPRLRRILRWVLCETLYLQNLPPEVLADVAVSHVRRHGGAIEAGFVNALLRRFLRETAEAWRQRVAGEAPPAVRLGLSPELYTAWAVRFTPERLTELAALLQIPAPLSARRRGVAPVTPPDCPPFLDPLPSPEWAPDACLYQVSDAAVFFASEAFQRGDFYIQDPSTLLAPALLAVRPGEHVADLCAAPGGKAILLAEALAGQGMLTCADRSPGRLRTLRENLGACPGVRFLVADSATPPLPAAAFDAVLLDVPCSNTGVIRRRPDVRWRFSRKHRAELVGLQAQILRGAAPLLRPGGRLVYSTCSIEPEENGEQVRAFLRDHPAFTLVTEKLLLPAPGNDGAYAALLTC